MVFCSAAMNPGVKANGSIVLLASGLDQVEVAVGSVANVGPDAPAEVVTVFASVTARGPLNDHAPNLAVSSKHLPQNRLPFK
jgi:hypothetical protein